MSLPFLNNVLLPLPNIVPRSLPITLDEHNIHNGCGRSATSDDTFEIKIDKIPARTEATFNCTFIAPLVKQAKVVSGYQHNIYAAGDIYSFFRWILLMMISVTLQIY